MDANTEHDVEITLKAVNDTAKAVSTRFITLLSVTTYVAVTVAATTHEMLLRATNLVTLPLLNAQIPIIGPFGFYTIAPWLIVLLHADLLLQLSILATELMRLERFLAEMTLHAREQIRQRMENFYYVLYLAGQAPSQLLHLLSAFITWITAVALPLMILLGIQIRFLPSHSPTDTWLHRGAILVDAALVIFVALPRLVPFSPTHLTDPRWRQMLRPMSVRGFTVLACAISVTLSLFVVTIPGEYGYARAWFPRNMELREQVLTANAVKPEDLDALRDHNLRDLTKLGDVLARIAPLKALNGRDFRYADLHNAVMPRIDFRALRLDSDSETPPAPLPEDCAQRLGCVDPADCEDALRRPTELAGATLTWASSQRGMFDDALLDNADLGWATLQQGSFARARMNGASLAHANLQKAALQDAKLCGADMKEAILPNAILARAFMRGARLQWATLTGADLSETDLRGADLRGADLSSAILSGADLTNADLRGAKLDGATMNGTNTTGAILKDAADNAAVDKGGGSSSVDAPRTAYLAALACESTAVAHGIARQAIDERKSNSTSLAKALRTARRDPACAGILALPRTMLRELRRSPGRHREGTSIALSSAHRGGTTP